MVIRRNIAKCITTPYTLNQREEISIEREAVKAKIVYKSLIPKLFSVFMPVSAVTLWPFIFIRENHPSPTLLQHELIHIKQASELWVVGFYVLYVLDWLKALWIYRKPEMAYRRIRFEQEAYIHQDDPEYLRHRPRQAWRAFSL